LFASCTVYKFASIKFYFAELAKAREPFLRKKVDLWLRERPDVKGNYHFSYAIVDEGRKTCKVAIAFVLTNMHWQSKFPAVQKVSPLF